MGRGESKHEGKVKKERWDGRSETLLVILHPTLAPKKKPWCQSNNRFLLTEVPPFFLGLVIHFQGFKGDWMD